MQNHSPYDVTNAHIRRTADGIIDTDYYHHHARALHAGFLRAVLSCIAHHGWRAWGCIKAKMDERATRQTLAMLSTRELKDVGLTRGDTDALVDGTYFSDTTRSERSRERLRKCA